MNVFIHCDIHSASTFREGCIHSLVHVPYTLCTSYCDVLFFFRGFESILEDYVPQVMKKVAYPLLYCVSLATFAGLMYLNYTDVGICRAVQMIWSLK